MNNDDKWTTKKIGIISYNIYGNFTNYGSALQSWALNQAIKKMGFSPVLIDYCPNIHLDKNILNPLERMWDQDEESRINCELTLPAIRENYCKFEAFFTNRFVRTTKYTSENFESSTNDVDSYICGSDTIFCIDESNGFDDGFFANFICMKGNSVAYAASFGDTKITEHQYKILEERLNNFKAIGLRETKMIDYVQNHTNCPVSRTIDPTLLLRPHEYNEITEARFIPDKYLLLYTRRYNLKMQKYAEDIAKKEGWKVVEISLRATHAEKGHIMQYKSGVEEFLSLVKHAEYIVTNSFHGLMFSVQFKKQFAIFSRESGDSKIKEALELFGLRQNLLTDYTDEILLISDYNEVHKRIAMAREKSLNFLKEELELL